MKLGTLDDNPPVDILLPPDIESDKSGDPETRLDEPAFIEEPKYMKLYKTYIKNDLHVSLTRLSNDEIQQKTRRKPIKTCRKAITTRPVTVKANPTAARKYIFKLKRTITIHVWGRNAMPYLKAYENGMNITVTATPG